MLGYVTLCWDILSHVKLWYFSRYTYLDFGCKVDSSLTQSSSLNKLSWRLTFQTIPSIPGPGLIFLTVLSPEFYCFAEPAVFLMVPLWCPSPSSPFPFPPFLPSSLPRPSSCAGGLVFLPACCSLGLSRVESSLSLSEMRTSQPRSKPWSNIPCYSYRTDIRAFSTDIRTKLYGYPWGNW